MAVFVNEEAEDEDAAEEEIFKGGVAIEVGEEEEKDPKTGLDLDGDVGEFEVHGCSVGDGGLFTSE